MQLTGLLTTLCSEQALMLRNYLSMGTANVVNGQSVTVGTTGARNISDFLNDDSYLFNLFLFASYLPAQDSLFLALIGFHKVGLTTTVLASGRGGRAARQLRQALTFQQVDSRLEEYWLGLIHQDKPAPLTDEENDRFLDAWTALLWGIPPVACGSEGWTYAVD